MNVIQLMHTLLATSTFVRLLGGFGLTWIYDLGQKKIARKAPPCDTMLAEWKVNYEANFFRVITTWI